MAPAAAILFSFLIAQEEDVKRVVRVSKYVVIITTRANADVGVDTDTGAPQTLAESAEHGVKVVAIKPSCYKVKIKDTAYPLDEIPDAQMRDNLSETKVTCNASGYLIENSSATALVALVAANEEQIPAAYIVGPGGRLQVPQGHLTCVRLGTAARYTWTPPAGAQQQEEPPKFDPEKRLQEPGTPGMPTGFYFNNPIDTGLGFAGHTPCAAGFFGSVDLKIPDTVSHAAGGGFTFTIDNHWFQKDFTCAGMTHTFDLRAIRCSVGFFYGECTGEMTSTVIQDTPPPATVLSVDKFEFKGTLLGGQFGVYWPALCYAAPGINLSIGPEITYMYIEERVERVGHADFHDVFHENVGLAGGKLSCRIFGFTLEGTVAQAFNDMEGLTYQATAGYTITW